MGNKHFKFKHHPITIVNQIFRMNSCYPGFVGQHNRTHCSWKGNLQPTPLSKNYNIRIDYELGHAPRVNVISPPLKCRNGETSIPHTYGTGQICLYLPWGGEWTDEKFIADTIVPWVSLWLFYYEIWLAIGEWLVGASTQSTRNKEIKPLANNEIRM